MVEKQFLNSISLIDVVQVCTQTFLQLPQRSGSCRGVSRGAPAPSPVPSRAVEVGIGCIYKQKKLDVFIKLFPCVYIHLWSPSWARALCVSLSTGTAEGGAQLQRALNLKFILCISVEPALIRTNSAAFCQFICWTKAGDWNMCLRLSQLLLLKGINQLFCPL